MKRRQLDFDAEFDKPAPQTGLRSAPDSVDEWLGSRRPKRSRAPQSSQRVIDQYVDSARELASSGDWDGVAVGSVGGAMAGLYIICHERVYGVRPLEAMAPDKFPQVMLAASKQFTGCFNSDSHAMVEFVRWTWNREREREKWRKENGREGARIGWHLQFGASTALMTDYLLSRSRRR